MIDAKDPLRQLIDVVVYAPIGLILVAQKELPNLAASGRLRVDNQIRLARFIGKMAVKRGREELQRRLDAAESARNQLSSVIDADSVETGSGTTGPVNEGVVEPPPSPRPAPSLPEAVFGAVAEVAEPQTDHALPIDGYDSLAASQVVVRLKTLTSDELDEIRRHETTHRARRTILGKISQLQAR